LSTSRQPRPHRVPRAAAPAQWSWLKAQLDDDKNEDDDDGDDEEEEGDDEEEGEGDDDNDVGFADVDMKSWTDRLTQPLKRLESKGAVDYLSSSRSGGKCGLLRGTKLEEWRQSTQNDGGMYVHMTTMKQKAAALEIYKQAALSEPETKGSIRGTARRTPRRRRGVALWRFRSSSIWQTKAVTSDTHVVSERQANPLASPSQRVISNIVRNNKRATYLQNWHAAVEVTILDQRQGL
jgi:hypothetical protein